MRALPLLCLLLPVIAVADIQTVNTLHRPAADLLTLIKPHLNKQVGLSAHGNQLIVSGSATDIKKVQQLVKTLDTAPVKLLITVSSNDKSQINNQGAGVSIHSDLKNNTRVSANITQRSTHSDDNSDYSVTTVSGAAAWINNGQQVPVYQVSEGVGWAGRYRQFGTEYKSIDSGFYATSIVFGDNVSIRISQQKQQYRGDSVINTQGSHTEVRGKLGQWLNFASFNDTQKGTQAGIVSSYSTNSDRQQSLYIKVDKLP